MGAAGTVSGSGRPRSPPAPGPDARPPAAAAPPGRGTRPGVEGTRDVRGAPARATTAADLTALAAPPPGPVPRPGHPATEAVILPTVSADSPVMSLEIPDVRERVAIDQESG